MKKVQKTISLTPAAIASGKKHAEETGTNFSWVVEQLLRELSKAKKQK